MEITNPTLWLDIMLIFAVPAAFFGALCMLDPLLMKFMKYMERKRGMATRIENDLWQ